MMRINFFEYLKLLVKYRNILIRNLFIIVVISIILSLIWPKKYKATSSFIPSFDVSTPFSELRTTETFDLALLLEGPQEVTSDVYAVVMKSRTVMESVIKQTGIMDVFKNKSMEDAIETLEENSSIDVGDDKIVTLTVYMPDPVLSANVANTWISSLDLFNQTAIRRQGQDEVVFIKDRLQQLDTALDAASDTLASFDSRYRIFADSEETAAEIDIYAELVQELMRKQIELMKWHAASADMPIRKSLQLEIEGLRKKLMEMEYDSTAGIISKVPLSKLPWLKIEHMKFAREKDILASLRDYLLIEYKIAELKANISTSTITVIDEAVPPERREWPARVKIVVFSALMAVFFNMILVLAIENAKVRWK